jgi:hypothetical protein
MYSIYHFFKSLIKNKSHFHKALKLDEFPFDDNLLSCRNKGTFPDLAIRVNKDKSIFTGGELIELKDSRSYTVSSFNSTIPSRSKEVSKVIGSENSVIKQQMLSSGNDICSLPVRDVYYLVRGRRKNNLKVCLVSGGFFETIKIEELIRQSFSQVLDESLRENGFEISDNVKKMLLSVFSQQENFSKVRNVEKSSVKLRFWIMTEVKAEGNILNSGKYPEIEDNTLNFVLSCHNDDEEREILRKSQIVFGKTGLSRLNIFKIKHHFNGNFLVFQTAI